MAAPTCYTDGASGSNATGAGLQEREPELMAPHSYEPALPTISRPQPRHDRCTCYPPQPQPQEE